jgi:CcmD family protein
VLIDLVAPRPTADAAPSASAPVVAASQPASAPESAPPVARASSGSSGSPAPASSATTSEDRATAFRPVEGGPQLQSGETLLVEAYAAIWVILFALVLFSWRRQRRLDDRMVALEGALEKARREEGTSGDQGDP